MTATDGWRDDYALVYIAGGQRAHWMAPNQSPNNSAASALCGLNNWPGYFRGTGGQGEYEHVAGLPLCKTCRRKRAERDGTSDPGPVAGVGQ